MILFFNAAKDKEISAFLIKGRQIINRLRQKGDFKVSDQLLPMIDRLLKKNKIGFEGLGGIIVVVGPGPFTSVRIAVAIGNTLSYSLKIPVAGVKISGKSTDAKLIKSGLNVLKKTKIGAYIKPVYGGMANITRPKR